MRIGEKCIKCGSTNTIEKGNYITCKNCSLFRRKEKRKSGGKNGK